VTRWTRHRRRTIYESGWVNVYLDDVELPDGTHIDHHVLGMPKSSVGAVVLNDDRTEVLLLWRHRYITDTWGWEVPAGWVEPGEAPEVAVRREVEEETGYRVASVRPMVEYRPLAGLSDHHFRAFLATGAVLTDHPAESEETSRVEWVGLGDIARLTAGGLISDGPSLLMLSFYLGIDRAVQR
jgi:8-oxo-dGTP pyrophosphatase MutT (NUDIX family)